MWVFAAALGVGVLGCAEAEDESTGHAGTLPLMDLTGTAALNEAVARLVRDFKDSEAQMANCLLDEGFDYTARTIDVDITTGGGMLTRTESMRDVGYGIVESEGYRGVVVSVRGGEYPAAQADGIVAATAEGGACSDHVNSIDVQEELQVLTDDLLRIPPEVAQDRRMVDAQVAWRECMDSRGYPFGSSIDAFSYIQEKFDTLPDNNAAAKSALAAEEREVATADAECFDEHVQSAIEEVMSEL